jgi:cell wall-associated NlpC family hydrolase
MSVSGLSRAHQRRVRNRVVEAAELALRHRVVVHYTQGARRWEGIARKLHAHRGQYPHYADCSAFATWCLWNGLHVLYGVRDVVNHAGWKGGFTGTMLNGGVRVHGRRRVGDLILYGGGPNAEHVAVYVGGGMVISHGSEGGPYKLPVNYRSDVRETRRYI